MWSIIIVITRVLEHDQPTGVHDCNTTGIFTRVAPPPKNPHPNGNDGKHNKSLTKNQGENFRKTFFLSDALISASLTDRVTWGFAAGRRRNILFLNAAEINTHERNIRIQNIPWLRFYWPPGIFPFSNNQYRSLPFFLSDRPETRVSSNSISQQKARRLCAYNSSPKSSRAHVFVFCAFVLSDRFSFNSIFMEIVCVQKCAFAFGPFVGFEEGFLSCRQTLHQQHSVPKAMSVGLVQKPARRMSM